MITRQSILIRMVVVVSLAIGSCFTLAQAADIDTVVKAAYDKYKDLDEGANADYIPALAEVAPTLFGIVLITVDGDVYSAGDITTEVSIQSYCCH